MGVRTLASWLRMMTKETGLGGEYYTNKTGRTTGLGRYIYFKCNLFECCVPTNVFNVCGMLFIHVCVNGKPIMHPMNQHMSLFVEFSFDLVKTFDGADCNTLEYLLIKTCLQQVLELLERMLGRIYDFVLMYFPLLLLSYPFGVAYFYSLIPRSFTRFFLYLLCTI